MRYEETIISRGPIGELERPVMDQSGGGTEARGAGGAGGGGREQQTKASGPQDSVERGRAQLSLLSRPIFLLNTVNSSSCWAACLVSM